MPNVPGTKVWLRKKELDIICERIEDTPPMGRLLIAYDFAEYNVRRAKQGKRNIKTVKDFIIKWWFNYGHLGFPYGTPSPLSFERE